MSTLTLAPDSTKTDAVDDALPHVRHAVRTLLLASPAYAELDEERRRGLARDMVRVCLAAAVLIREAVAGAEPEVIKKGKPVEEGEVKAAAPGAEKDTKEKDKKADKKEKK